MKIISLYYALSFLLIHACLQGQELNKVAFLEGTWKIEGKDTYEFWEKEEGVLAGYSYKKVGEEKKMMETLSIEKKEGEIIYTAIVPNQNDGNAIPFKLNEEVKDKLSFENLTHDFPKKIQYQMIDGQKILVNVLGEGDKGFSYYIIKE